MTNMKVKVIWTCGLLILFLKGCFNRSVKDEYVELLERVEVWKGSCTMLPCKYTPKSTYNQFIWYYNAAYDDKKRNFNGTIVYNSTDENGADPLFAGRVQYVGKSDTDCTIVIRNIQKEDEGTYNLRLLGKKMKWMSKQPLTMAVSDIGSTLRFDPLPEIRESEDVTLSCSISYYCPSNISFYWIEDVNGTSTTDFRSDTSEVRTTSSLKFRPSWRDNKKNITCVLHRDDGESDNKTVQLNVTYAPKNVQIFSNATIEILRGRSTILTCSVESSNPPDYDITWFKEPQQRQNAKKGSASQLEVTYSGKYFCLARNKIGGTKSNSVEVSVLYAPDKPAIKKYLDPVEEGKDITLECSTKANPPVSRYVWFKDGDERYNHTSNQFTIYNIKEEHSGSYTCLARNKLGEAKSDMLDLNVMYAPRYPRVVLELDRPTIAEDDKIIFVEDKAMFVEGDKVIFRCNVNSSNPEVTNILWYKDGKIIPKLNQPIKAEHAGDYTCSAVNSVGRTMSPKITVDIHYPPKGVEIWFSRKSFKENETVQLRCLSKTSKPESSRYEWYKDGVLLRNATHDIMVLQLEWTHTGQYTCKALNAIGSGESPKRRIDVQYAPKNVMLTVIPGDHVTEHMDVTLKCTSRGNPTKIYYEFYLNNVYLSSNGGFFELKDVQIENIGEYSCSAKNLVGEKGSNVVFLHVSYSPATIGKFASIAASTFIVLLTLIILIVRFRVSIRNAFRRRSVDDKSESSFFVMKKKDEAIIVQPSSRLHRESADNIGHPNPSIHSSTDQLNYSRVNFPAPSKRQSNLSSAAADNDITTIYSVVRKVPNVHEYENIASSEIAHEDSQDEIHYSVIANLNKRDKERERDPEVEYAKLRPS